MCEVIEVEGEAIMKCVLFPICTISILMLTGCGAKVMTEPVLDENVSKESSREAPVKSTDAIVPTYVVDAKELFGLGIRESAGKVMGATKFWFRRNGGRHNMYLPRRFDYGRTEPYFKEKHITPIETYTLKDKAYLSLYFTEVDKNAKEVEVGRIELTHSGVVSAIEAVMMLGYDPNNLIEHPVKHRNAGTSNWFALIDSRFHLIEIQWFDAKKDDATKLGQVTQIRASVW